MGLGLGAITKAFLNSPKPPSMESATLEAAPKEAFVTSLTSADIYGERGKNFDLARETATRESRADTALAQDLLSQNWGVVSPDWRERLGALENRYDELISGNLPQDVADQVKRLGAEQGISLGRGYARGQGFGGVLGMSDASDLRNYGLTSLDLIRQGMSYAPTLTSVQQQFVARPVQQSISGSLDRNVTGLQFMKAQGEMDYQKNLANIKNQNIMGASNVRNQNRASEYAYKQQEFDNMIAGIDAAGDLAVNVAGMVMTGGASAAMQGPSTPPARTSAPIYGGGGGGSMGQNTGMFQGSMGNNQYASAPSGFSLSDTGNYYGGQGFY